LADCGGEAGEEGVEGVVAYDEAVEELQAADEDEEGKEGVDEFYTLGRDFPVVLPEVEDDILRTLIVRGRCSGGF